MAGSEHLLVRHQRPELHGLGVYEQEENERPRRSVPKHIRSLFGIPHGTA